MSVRHALFVLARGSLRFLVVVALFLLCTALVRAQAPTQGSSLETEDFEAYRGWRVARLEVRGAPAALAEDLRKGLALAGTPSLFGGKRASFSPRLLEEDVERSRLFLARHGYPGARVSPAIERLSGERRIAVLLRIEPGPQVGIREARAEGFPDVVADRLGELDLAPADSIVNDPFIEERVARLTTILQDAGYAQAVVQARLEATPRAETAPPDEPGMPATAARLGADSTSVALVYSAQAGPRFRFGWTEVSGASPDLVPLAKRTASIDHGAIYSPGDLKEAGDRLRLLGLFRQVRVTTRDTGRDTLQVVLDLTEREPRTIRISVGYWTDEQFRGRVRWEHRNLFRRGRGLAAEASYSRFTQIAQLSAWWPAIFGGDHRGEILTRATREDEESYELWSGDLEAADTYSPSLATSARAGITLSQVDVTVRALDRAAFSERGGLLTFFSLQGTRNTAVDRLNPADGFAADARIEWGLPGMFSDSHYLLAESSGSLYRTLFARVVGVLYASVAWGRPLGDSEDLLPNKRFYAGGAGSMRGFGRRELGPQDDSGAPLGGEACMLASTEIRIPLVWRFVGALFVDAGQVWRLASDIDGDIEVAAGPGLMIMTPVGPVRADIGYRLTEFQTGQPDWLFHLSVGHPF